MARRIYEERFLNNSTIGFSVSAISGLTPPVNARHINIVPDNNMNITQNDNETTNLTAAQLMTSTPMLGANLAVNYYRNQQQVFNLIN